MQYKAIFHGCKNVIFQMKFFNILFIFAQNIDCGYTLEPPQRGGSNEYPQSMFWRKNKKKMHTPVNPSFTVYKQGVKANSHGMFCTYGKKHIWKKAHMFFCSHDMQRTHMF